MTPPATADAATTTTDAIVVGGGVIALAAANALLGAGLRVASVFPEASEDRPVASRAAGAMLGAFGEVTSDDSETEDPGFAFRLQAQRLYPQWLGEVCERAGRSVHQARGTFIVANNDGISDRASVNLMKQRADRAGEPAAYAEPEDVPGLNPNPHHAPGLCLHLPGEHAVDSHQLLDALRASAASFDGWTHVPDAAAAARPDGEGWTVKTSGGRVIRAEHVVLSAGSRSFEVLHADLRRAAGLPEMYFGKGVSCLVSGGPPITSTIRTPNRAFACGIHAVPRAGGLLYLGATNRLGSDHDANRGIEPGELHSLFDDILHQISTDLRETRIEGVHVGFRPIASHGRPVIGATHLPGLSVGTGTYRDGVLMAPLVAAIVTAEITRRPGPANPFPATSEVESPNPAVLVEVGIRDIIALAQEPRGPLPYDRAEQLRKYVTTLFRIAVDDGDRFGALRDQIQHQLQEAPLDETMHKLFREIVEHTEADGLDPQEANSP